MSRRGSYLAPSVVSGLVFVGGRLPHIFAIDMTVSEWAAIQNLVGSGGGGAGRSGTRWCSFRNSNRCFLPS